MYINDTIAAISTPLGEGGIGVIRISGDRAGEIGATLFSRKPHGGFESHRFYYGSIIDPVDGTTLDEVLLVFMKAPRSYTCEDVLEIHCHGGCLMVQRVLSLALQKGARLAAPGEFTRRAFLNGRIDLIQAEAVIDVIRGKTEAALALAQHQREGYLSKQVYEIREQIVKALALVEAYIDFPEEDIDKATGREISEAVLTARQKCSEILDGYDEGKALRDGVSVVIAGRPNVGKSSLLNTFLREKRAIVTAIPGTTRDVIEEVVNIRGLPVRLLDTAGICDTEDVIEREGVGRAMEKMQRADLILFVLDSSRPMEPDDLFIAEQLGDRKFIQVLNKCDLPEAIELPEQLSQNETIRVSTKSGEGMELLHDAIRDYFLHGRTVDSREYVVLSNARQRDALEKCHKALMRSMADAPLSLDLELLAADLREALQSVGEVTGVTTNEEVLDIVFQRFCIGK